ncbi:HD domain-containing protein [Francisella sp. Scap27]|uniref:HD domain-containing protein n=1 Tax=Francisella sp. Scap27 TaxID=2589986 RepID=UPI0015BA59F8|nr:HD domain-containing protein [Francisella sp. Scap27]QLE78748.1 HD domain-containing protein [Francisella sp. Scap27]
MSFTNLKNAESEELENIALEQKKAASKVIEHIVSHLDLLKGDFAGFPIDRYDHCLQTATRAFRDGMDDEYVVCALLHDIGDTLAPYNHGELAAKLLQPYILEKNYFMIEHHGVFQGYYFWGKIGLDENARDKYVDSPYYDYTDQFCKKYDCPSFDLDYKNMTIEEFMPMLEKVISSPNNNVYSNIFKKV